jgi:molecular chaperone GrpE
MVDKKDTKKVEDQKSSEEMTQIETLTEKFEKQFQEAKKLAEERLNDLKYLHADFDNFRKQMNKEREQIIAVANENLVKELVIVLDDFDASLKAIKDDENKEGLERLHKKFLQILEKRGLKKIESLGKKLDPNFHEVLCNEFCEKEDDEIIEEIQKGYTLGPKVIRPSKVKIAKRQDLNSVGEEN